jgi:outer membrane murein-binding lipoprotein Lpp
MAEASLDELLGELARLEAEEAQLSSVRDRLHSQIDFGFGSETARAREREVSDERQELHRRIDALRERVRARQAV